MRSEFNLSREHKTTVDMGELIPVLTEEVLPGDTFIHSVNALARVSPLAHPLMHRVELRLHTFYVPNRILWDGKAGDPFPGNWEDFITGEDDVNPKPTYTQDGQGGETLLDYMGIPPVTGLTTDALPIRAYNLIFNEMYRDQNLVPERAIDDVTLAKVAWQKDYFTVARPTPQQGDPIPIPLAGTGNVKGADPLTPLETLNIQMDGTANQNLFGTNSGGSATLTVDLNTLAMSIDDFRRSMALQRFAEARMRFGSRYVDYLRYMGVNPSDGRLDRPEYLGGGKQVLSFSEVLQTANLDAAEGVVGDMYGHGIGMAQASSYRKMFEEHGWVLTLLSVRPKTVYQDALPRKFTRTTAMDYYQQELEVLPWQEVSQQEVYAPGDPDTVFGYVPRYEEYRHGVSCVSGSMRGGTENDWHLAREFEQAPNLNASFIQCNPSERIYQDANQPNLVLNIMHNIRARRLVGPTATMGQDI